MADTNELLPEEVDEQHQRLIRDLRLMYRADGQKVQHIARVQQRLLNNEGSLHPLPGNEARDIQQRATRATQASPPPILTTPAPTGDVKPTRSPSIERKPWQRRMSMIAAVLVAALVVSSLLFVLNLSHRSSPGSSAKPTGGLNTLPTLLSLHMIDASTGWALTGQTVLRTTDGGVHWKNVTPAGATLTQDSIADFPSASIASIGTPRPDGASTQVLPTADGGQNWQQSTIQMPLPRQISFIDAQRGWVLAAVRPLGGPAEPVSVFRTTDGGKTWVNVATALFSDATPPGKLPYGGQKSGMHFLDASTGWVTGTVFITDLAWLYVTHDGGSTWQPQSLLMPPGVPSARLSLLSPTFFSTADGILPVIFSNITTDSAIATAIYTTHDGGRTWQSTAPIAAALPLLSFADLQHGWATYRTMLYRTIHGVHHWINLSPSSNFKNITQIDFVSTTVGWAITSATANSSSLLKTVDGGLTWTSISATSA